MNLLLGTIAVVFLFICWVTVVKVGEVIAFQVTQILNVLP